MYEFINFVHIFIALQTFGIRRKTDGIADITCKYSCNKALQSLLRKLKVARRDDDQSLEHQTFREIVDTIQYLDKKHFTATLNNRGLQQRQFWKLYQKHKHIDAHFIA